MALHPLQTSQKPSMFLAFTLACPKQPTQASGRLGKRSSLTAVSGVAHWFMPSLRHFATSLFL